MRVLIVSDIHSNLEAFQSVVADAESRGGFDRIWSLGDLIGYGPDPGPCIDMLRRYDHLAVAGNHDLASVGLLRVDDFNPHAAAANRWTATTLSDEHRDHIKGLELMLVAEGFTIVHGSPRYPVWEYMISTDVAIASFVHMETDWCLVGHSHVPFLCLKTEDRATFLEFPLDTPVKLGGGKLIINPGGVGQPRDSDPRASYAVFDTGLAAITHYRVGDDVQKTQEKMKLHDLPESLIERLSHGR